MPRTVALDEAAPVRVGAICSGKFAEAARTLTEEVAVDLCDEIAGALPDDTDRQLNWHERL
jgi:hypothetical protein